MKKHWNRPALYGCDLWRWMRNHIIDVERIRWTPIYKLNSGKHVRQKWLRRTQKGWIVTKTAVTYLKKGMFLSPRWLKVPSWEIAYLLARFQNLEEIGIVSYDGNFFRLIYMQVEDLDHITRQHDHILDQYFNSAIDFYDNLADVCRAVEKKEKIIERISEKKVGVEAFRTLLQIELQKMSTSITSYIENTSLFNKKIKEESNPDTIMNSLNKKAKKCRELAVRPIHRKLFYAAKSLELAINHILVGRLDLAKARLKSAIKNLEYPEKVQ